MINKINYSLNQKFLNVRKLASYSGIIGIYGAGVYGKWLGEELVSCSVIPDYYIVDSIYLKEQDKVKLNGGTHTIPVITPEQYIKINCEHKALIVGFGANYHAWKGISAKVENLFIGCEIIDFENPYLFDFSYIDYWYFLKNYHDFLDTYHMLADDESKQLLVEFINASISGDSSAFSKYKEDDELNNGYDYSILLNKKDGIIVECGAYDGKTALQINRALQTKQFILALEPDSQNYQSLCDTVAAYSNIQPINVGSSHCDGNVYFSNISSQGSCIVSEDEKDQYEHLTSITVNKIDTLLEDKKVASIIMDVEGSELDSLKGAYNVIKKNHPTLAVRVYHKREDLITIPQYLYSIFEGEERYKLYIRYDNIHNRGTVDTTIYAI